MGDMGDVFHDMRKAGQEKRASNRVSSTQRLKDQGFAFTSHNEGAHLIVTHGNQVADFWPGTGRWKVRGHKRGFGVESLMVALRWRKAADDKKARERTDLPGGVCP